MIERAVAAFLLGSADSRAVAIRADVAAYANSLAIFTCELPSDAPFPAILITKPASSEFGCRDNPGELAQVDIQVLGNKAPSKKSVSDRAKAVRKFINRSDDLIAPYLQAEGFECWGVFADAPTNTQDGLNFPGYTIKAHIRVLDS